MTTTAQAPPPPPSTLPTNGTLLRHGNDPKVYLMMEGKKCWVPNRPSFDILFTGMDAVVSLDSVDQIPTGETLSDCATLVKASDDAATYLLNQGKKHHVASPDAMRAYSFDWNKVFVVGNTSVLDAIPTGSVLE